MARYNVFLILSILLFSSITLLIDDYYLLGQIYFYAILFFVIFSVISKKNINLVDVWNIAFLFIIVSEIFVSDKIDNSYLPAIKYLLIANNIINIGYLTLNERYTIIREDASKTKEVKRDHIMVGLVLIGITILFFLLKIQNALYIFSTGRNVVISEGSGKGFFLDSIWNSIGFVLPALVCYYYIFILNRSIWIPLIISSPIFIVLFLGGTRFPLLFSLLGFFIVYQSKFIGKFTIKHYILIFIIVIGLGYTSVLMKHYRSSVTMNTEFSLLKTEEAKDLPTLVSTSIMSPEGVIDMTNLLFDYFDKNDHLYGASSSFILYFWIPRQIWPDKPTMLGHWFIRKYRSGFAEGHSASFGFTGDLYADFGLFSLFFVFLLGRLLKVAENFKNKSFRTGGYNVVIGAILFPYVFFFVRSPITSTMTFLGMLFFHYIFKRLIFIK